MFTRVINKPACLSDADIQRWIDDFYFCSANFGITSHPDVFSDTVLEFSESFVCHTYIFETIKAALEGIFRRRITEDMLWDIAQAIAGVMPDNNYSDDRKAEIVKKLAELFGIPSPGTVGADYMLGVYMPSENKIIIYTRTIDSYYSGIAPAAAYESVAEHEMFHRYHHFYCTAECGRRGVPNEYELRRDYRSTVVKESLADRFSYYYCHTGSNPDFPKIEDALRSAWINNEPHVYPYSGARFIFKKTDFCEILDSSADNFDAALRKLFKNDPTALYSVINAVFISSAAKKVRTATAAKTKKAPRKKSAAPNFIDKLHGMGTGWFILKYASEHGVPVQVGLDYGTDNSMKRRNSIYRNTTSIHDKMIRYLKTNGIDDKTKAGSPALAAPDIRAILSKL